MNLDVDAKAFEELLSIHNTIQILLAETADRDSVASALALYLSIAEKGKNVSIAYPKPVTVAWNSLIGVNKITQHFSNKNFIISLDYIEGSIEKVSYNIEGNKFNLVIEPRPDAPPFNEKSVQYQYTGGLANMFITIDTPELASLGKFYHENKDAFTDKPIVAISANVPPHDLQQYGKLNIIRPAAATAEVVASLIKQAHLSLNGDIATNLYDGLTSGSRSFAAPQVTAETFEIAAWLLKSGARKSTNRFPTNEEMPRREFGITNNAESEATPPDWFKPKIFKGGSGGML